MKAIALIFALLAPAAAHADSVDDQWLYRELEGAGMQKLPAAVFLDWTYSSVVLRVDCDPAAKDLVFNYYGDGVAILTAEDQLELILGDDFLPMPTTLNERGLEGRLPAAKVLAAWNADDEVGLLAPTEQGEPWATGKAAPLRRVAEACR